MAEKPRSNANPDRLPKMTLEDWVLTAIYDKDERRPRDAPTLMNEILIFTKEVVPSLESEFGFKSTGSGPYSRNVANAINRLLSKGMLEIKGDEPSEYGGYYILTDSGTEKAENLISKLLGELREDMDFMRIATANMGPKGMLQYLHSVYPEFVYLQRGGG
jgi:hypothetical protein